MAVVDNFDADISSQNGKISTHSLAVLVTQPTSSVTNGDIDNKNTIERLTQTSIARHIDYDMRVERYSGP